jgi:hypothetical protein
MAHTDRDAHNAYNREWRRKNREKSRLISRRAVAKAYAEDPERFRRRSREHYYRQRAWFDTQKENPCADCGVQYPPCVMDFHHRDPAEKLFQIGPRVHASRVRLLAEIAKCDLLCSNCHRLREAGLREAGLAFRPGPKLREAGLL